MELSAGKERRVSPGGSEGGSGTQVLATRVRESAGQPVGSERPEGGGNPLISGLQDPAAWPGSVRGPDCVSRTGPPPSMYRLQLTGAGR